MNIPDNSDIPESENNDASFDASNPASRILDFSNLFGDQRRFFEWLYTSQGLQPYQQFWSIHPSPKLDLELAKKWLTTASAGEAHMLRFLVGIWLGSNALEFDMYIALRDLDDPEMQIIQLWMKDPFFP